MTILVHMKVWVADDFTMGNEWETCEFPDWRSVSEWLSTVSWEHHESEGGWLMGDGTEGEMTVHTELRWCVIEYLPSPEPTPEPEVLDPRPRRRGRPRPTVFTDCP